VVEGSAVRGFQLQARLPYYRGLGLSMVENVALTVDGEAIPREAIRVTLHGNTYTLDQIEHELDDRWEFGEIGTVTVEQPGGLAPGEHTIELAPTMRISYLPFPLTGRDRKRLRLEV
jgi:hypothetical protein